MNSSKRPRSPTKKNVRTQLNRFAENACRLADAAHDLHERAKTTHDRAHQMHEMERPPLHKRVPGKEVNWVVPE